MLKPFKNWCHVGILCSSLFGMNAFAEVNPFTYKLSQTLEDHASIREIEEEPMIARVASADLPEMASPDSFLPGSLEGIVNLGKSVWTLIELGRPSNQMENTFATGLPEGASWEDLESWSSPTSRTFEVSYKNGLGITSVVFTYRILYTWGGQHKDRGQYLTNVSVKTPDASVSWGTRLAAKVEIPSVVNVGTVESPIAGLQMHISWNVSTVFSSVTESMDYFVKGDGAFENLNFKN